MKPNTGKAPLTVFVLGLKYLQNINDNDELEYCKFADGSLDC